MVTIFLFVLFLIPAMLGIAEILHIIKLFILKPQKSIISYKIVILTNDMPFEHMKYVIEKYIWQHSKNSAKLIFVYSLLDEENFNECKMLAEQFGLGFYSKEEIVEYFNIIVA